MSGPGTTRIDVVLANTIASAAVKGVETIWERAILFDHTPIRVRLSIRAMTQLVQRPGRPIGIDADKFRYQKNAKSPAEREQIAKEAAADFDIIWKHFKPGFDKAIDDEDIDEAHKVWCLGCELWLYLAQEDTDDSIERFLMRGVPRRGTPMPIRYEQLIPEVEEGSDTAIMAVSRQLLKAIASAKGIMLYLQSQQAIDQKAKGMIQELLGLVIKMVATEKRAQEEIRKGERAAEPNEGDEFRAGGKVVCPDERLRQDAEEHDEDTSREVHILLKNLGVITRIEGVKQEADAQAVTGAMREFICNARQMCTDHSHCDAKLRRKEMRKALNDPSRGHSKFFQALRADQRRPTSVLKIGDRLTANMDEIFNAFDEQWHGVYNRLEDSPPDFDLFEMHYGRYMQAQPTGDLIPNGDQLAANAGRAKPDSAAGRDAWKPAELALLPTFAWHERARLLKLCAHKGRWPSAYKEVSSPCLQKKDKLDPDAGRAPPTVLDHRLLSIYTALYRIEMGAWCKNHTDWLAKNIHESCCGAMAGREPGEASWDAQSAVAAAMEQGEDMVLAMLDYYKFFDSFEPKFYAKFLEKMGIHSNLVRLFLDLNVNAVRRVKIGNALGKPFQTFNALGQGDPLTLVVALLYVSVQFVALDQICPKLRKSVVVDDRNLRGEGEDILRAWNFIYRFGIRAGHLTNPKKLALLATTKSGKAWCGNLTLEGVKPKILDKEMLVGDVITTLRKGNGFLATKFVNHAVRGAEQNTWHGH